jgi:hypothetical protein
MKTYMRMHKGQISPPSSLDISRFDPWPTGISREKDPDETMLMLLPSTVFGFMLQEKTWRMLILCCYNFKLIIGAHSIITGE